METEEKKKQQENDDTPSVDDDVGCRGGNDGVGCCGLTVAVSIINDDHQPNHNHNHDYNDTEVTINARQVLCPEPPVIAQAVAHQRAKSGNCPDTIPTTNTHTCKQRVSRR